MAEEVRVFSAGLPHHQRADGISFVDAVEQRAGSLRVPDKLSLDFRHREALPVKPIEDARYSSTANLKSFHWRYGITVEPSGRTPCIES